MALFDAVAALLFREDPIGISFENDNLDEYELEARYNTPRLKGYASADEVLRVVHEEFVRWFDAENAGLQEKCRQIASEIWQLGQQRVSH